MRWIVKRPRKIIGIIVGLVVSVALISAFPRGIRRGRMSLITIFKLPLRASHRIFYHVKEIIRYRSLLRENEEYRATVDILTSQITRLKEASIENERLRGLLNFKAASRKKLIAATVIGRDSSNWSRTILINKGTDYGIKEDMVVLTHRGLVGRITEVGPTVSRTMLITDPNSRVAAIIQSSREEGLLCGTATRMCRLKYISVDAKINPGDEVISSGFGGIYPKGLALGAVVSTGREEGGLSMFAVVRPATNFSRLEEVLVWME